MPAISEEAECVPALQAQNAISAITVMFKSVKVLFIKLKETGNTGMDQEVFRRVRKEIEDTIGLEEYYRIEESTVENKK